MDFLYDMISKKHQPDIVNNTLIWELWKKDEIENTGAIQALVQDEIV